MYWVSGASTSDRVFEFIDLNDEKFWSCKEEHERNVWQRSKGKDYKIVTLKIIKYPTSSLRSNIRVKVGRVHLISLLK